MSLLAHKSHMHRKHGYGARTSINTSQIEPISRVSSERVFLPLHGKYRFLLLVFGIVPPFPRMPVVNPIERLVMLERRVWLHVFDVLLRERW